MKWIFGLILPALFCSSNAFAQLVSTTNHGDPLSSHAVRTQSRFIFEHQHLTPSAPLLDSAMSKVHGGALSLCTGPILDVAGGVQTGSSVRGLADGNAGASILLAGMRPVRAEISYQYIASALPSHMLEQSVPYDVLWNVGNAKRNGDVFLSHNVVGQVGVRCGKYVALDAGRQAHHIGDGYRSLILGRQAAPLPFFRATAQVHKVRFFAEWMRAAHPFPTAQKQDDRHKFMAMHGLSMNLGKRFNWSVYEMVVWQERDTLNRRGLELHYLNPIVFYRPLEYAQGSADNVILASTMRYKASPKVGLYAQIVLDEFKLSQLRRELKWWANKYGAQLGVKWHNVIPELHMLWEGNVVRPFTYTHGSPVQSWTHWSQPLAHPLGANFAEVLWRSVYQRGHWKYRAQLLYSAYGRDRDMNQDGFADNLGGDLNRSYKNPFQQYGNALLQGDKTNVFYQQLEVARAIGAEKAFEIYVQQHYRHASSQLGSNEQFWLLVGFRAAGMLSALRDI